MRLINYLLIILFFKISENLNTNIININSGDLIGLVKLNEVNFDII